VANKTPKFLNQQNAGMHAMQAVSIKKYLIGICLALNTPNLLSVAKSSFV